MAAQRRPGVAASLPAAFFGSQASQARADALRRELVANAPRAAAPPPRPAERYAFYDAPDMDAGTLTVLERHKRDAWPKCLLALPDGLVAAGCKKKAPPGWVMTHTQPEGGFFRDGQHGVICADPDHAEAALSAWYKEMALDIAAVERGRGRLMFFSECGPSAPEARTVLFFDVDLYVAPDVRDAGPPDRAALVEPFAAFVARRVHDMYPAARTTDAVVATTVAIVPAEKNGVQGYKCGIHLYWPGVLVTRARHTMVWRTLLAALQDSAGDGLFADARCSMISSWDGAFDREPVKHRQLRMIGSDKIAKCGCTADQMQHGQCRHPLKTGVGDKVQHYTVNPLRRYTLFGVFAGATGALDAARTAFYRADLHRLLVDVSLAVPRKEEETPCTLPLDHLCERFPDDGATGEDDEDKVQWAHVELNGADLSSERMEVYEILVELCARQCAKPPTRDVALEQVVDGGGFFVGHTKRSEKEWYKLFLRTSYPCVNKGSPHKSERNYLMVSPAPMYELSWRCSCKCPDSAGRAERGGGRAVRCADFQLSCGPLWAPYDSLRLLFKFHRESTIDAHFNRIVAPQGPPKHPDMFESKTMAKGAPQLNNRAAILWSQLSIALLKPHRRYPRQADPNLVALFRHQNSNQQPQQPQQPQSQPRANDEPFPEMAPRPFVGRERRRRGHSRSKRKEKKEKAPSERKKKKRKKQHADEEKNAAAAPPPAQVDDNDDGERLLSQSQPKAAPRPPSPARVRVMADDEYVPDDMDVMCGVYTLD
jgi:hypothetical protein